MHKKPKMPRHDRKKLRTQTDKYRGRLLMQFIIKSEEFLPSAKKGL